MIWILFTFLAMAQEVEEAEISLNELIPEASQRHISTVVESRITRQFTEVPQISECAKNHKVTKEMIEDPTRLDEVRLKQQAASNCVRDKLASVSDEDLEKMSAELGLKQHGLIKGTGAKAVTDYFATRFSRVFYVKDKNNKDIPLVLDQKMFFDLYESQLGKSVLLEISNFCFNHVTIKGDSGRDRKDVFDLLNSTHSELTSTNASTIAGGVRKFSDAGKPPSSPAPVTAGSTPQPQDPNKIYEDFLAQVVVVANGATPTQAQKERLQKIYESCGRLIVPMCKVFEDCNCYYRKTTSSNPASITCTGSISASNYGSECFDAPNSTTPIVSPQIGSSACHIAGRMRAHRSNLTAVNKQQDLLSDKSLYLTEDEKGFKQGERGPKRYQGGEQSLDDLTSLSSKEIDQITAQKEFNTNCESNPDDETCKDYLYGADESAKFKNTTASYSAATQIEVEKLKRLGTQSTDELKKFLTAKGYLDLIKSLEGGNGVQPMSPQDVVNQAIQRFEAQRDATFAEMGKAFEKNQLAGSTDKNLKIQKIKKDYEKRPEEFKQLMLFNNVVTSFLKVEKKNASGGFDEAGTNVRSLQRETRDNSVLEGLNQIGGQSTLGNSDSPIVDRTFIGNILGE